MIDMESASYAIAGFIGGIFAAIRAIRNRITKKWYDHSLDIVLSALLGYVLSVLFIHYIDWNPQLEYIFTAIISSQSHYVFNAMEKLIRKAFGDWLETVVESKLERHFDVDLSDKKKQHDEEG